MAKITERGGNLVFDFTYQNKRCRETTKLQDNPVNRKRAEAILERMQAEMLLGSFNYLSYFPKSKMAKKLIIVEQDIKQQIAKREGEYVPTFEECSQDWFYQMEPSWRDSSQQKIRGILDNYLLPEFKDISVNDISKSDVLTFRSNVAKQPGRKGELTAMYVNKIMMPFRAILIEAADKYNFRSPFIGIKPLKGKKSDVKPLSFDDIKLFLKNVRPDFKDYFTVRFFTALRSGEVHGLRWQNVDFQQRTIVIEEMWSRAGLVPPKTPSSYRTISMTDLVFNALKAQKTRSLENCEFVFSTSVGTPLDNKNVHSRIWCPTLRCLGLEERRLYQTRHTCATLWLASGESPEWIARQMGHSTTEMLFRVYSRYVPNNARNDGHAFDRLIDAEFREL